jgi:hypothetical protein
MRISPFLLPGALLVVAACTESTGPSECAATTGTVSVTVTKTASSVVFDWTPRCAVALVLVEQDGSDQWALESPDLNDTPTTASNIITPSVTYGETRAGAVSSTAEPLVTGQLYDVVLWRMIAPGTNAPCLDRFENACLLAVHEFTR